MTPQAPQNGDGAHPAAPGHDLDAATVMKMAERVVNHGGERRGAVGRDLGPEDARALLDAWLGAVGLDLRGSELIAVHAVR